MTDEWSSMGSLPFLSNYSKRGLNEYHLISHTRFDLICTRFLPFQLKRRKTFKWKITYWLFSQVIENSIQLKWQNNIDMWCDIQESMMSEVTEMKTWRAYTSNSFCLNLICTSSTSMALQPDYSTLNRRDMCIRPRCLTTLLKYFIHKQAKEGPDRLLIGR